MAVAETVPPTSPSWLESLIGLFVKPARLQIAALCYRFVDGEPEVLLLTSRGKGRWILPKGWPELHLEAHQTAELEAYEEAGIRGKADTLPYAKFNSHKGLEKGIEIRTTVLVFRIEVTEELDEYPEKGQRKTKWFSLSKAIDKADEPGVRKMLKRFRREMARKARNR